MEGPARGVGAATYGQQGQARKDDHQQLQASGSSRAARSDGWVDTPVQCSARHADNQDDCPEVLVCDVVC